MASACASSRARTDCIHSRDYLGEYSTFYDQARRAFPNRYGCDRGEFLKCGDMRCERLPSVACECDTRSNVPRGGGFVQIYVTGFFERFEVFGEKRIAHARYLSQRCELRVTYRREHGCNFPTSVRVKDRVELRSRAFHVRMSPTR